MAREKTVTFTTTMTTQKPATEVLNPLYIKVRIPEAMRAEEV